MQSQYPCKREAQRGVTHRVKRRKQWDKAEMRVVCHKLRNTSSHQGGRVAPPQFQPSDTDLGPLASETLGEFISIVLGHQVSDDLLQQLRETLCPNIDNINHDVWEVLTVGIYAFLISTPHSDAHGAGLPLQPSRCVDWFKEDLVVGTSCNLE